MSQKHVSEGRGRWAPYRRKDSPRWYARRWDPTAKSPPRISLGTTDYQVARKKVADLNRELEFGLDGADTDLGGLARRFLQSQRRRICQEYLRDQRRHITLFLDHCRVDHARAVRPAHVRRFLEDLDVSPATVNRYRASLHALFEFAYRDELVPDNIVRMVRPYREARKGVPVFLDDEEVDLLLDAVIGTPLEIPVAVMIYAGLRRGEVVALRWEDVDFIRRLLHVRRASSASGRIGPTKGRAERTLPLADRLAEILRPGGKKGYVTSYRGRPWWPTTLSRQIVRVGEELGMEKLNGPQVLRRTFGSRLVLAGEPIAEVSWKLGHSSVKVTEQSYIGLVPERRGRIDDL